MRHSAEQCAAGRFTPRRHGAAARSAGRGAVWAAVWGLAFACAFGAVALPSARPVSAQTPGLAIELNKTEEVDGGCLASFVLQNNLGAALDRFNLDLFLFDGEGVIVRRVLIDLAPLPDGKTRVAQFNLHSDGCSGLGRVLVNDVPQCRAVTGQSVDCLAGLTVSSRSEIALEK